VENLFIARQPIYNRDLQVMGYELLYRCCDKNVAMIEDESQASCTTIINSFVHIGLENLTGSALAFINLPERFILDENLTLMLKEQTVLEILEDVAPTKAVIQGLTKLKARGFLLALDDFVFTKRHIPLLKLADYVKIDVHNLSEEQIADSIKKLKPFQVKLIAEKVETQALYAICQQFPFEAFQGFFFCHPEMVKQKHAPANKMVLMSLLGKLQNPELDYDEFESILAQDVTLSYKLLRYINSATFSLRREIDSIKDVVVLLGLNNVKNWLSLIMMSNVSNNKPCELIATALIRAKMCELLAEKFYPDVKSQMFIIGLFSVLDALMDTPLDDLLDTVTLSIGIKMALLFKEGEQGEIYALVLEYEHSHWDALNKPNIDPNECISAYLIAVQWADDNMKALKATCAA